MTILKQFARILPVHLRSPVRIAWRKYVGNVEFQTLALLADKERIALDIGANSGSYTVELARLATSCVAFEPNQALAVKIREKVAAGGLSNVRVEACALSNRDAEVKFRVPIVNGVEAAELGTIEAENGLDGVEVRSYTVPSRRLDDLGLERVGLMKIDAEGHETAILCGARSLIERDQPAVMIEVEERHKSGSVQYVRDFFASYNYRGYFLLGRKIAPIEQFDIAENQNVNSIEGGKVRLDAIYSNNFVFAADAPRISKLDELARSGRMIRR